MKLDKTFLFGLALILILGIAFAANAHKYQRKTSLLPSVQSAEATTSMSDCMTYSASHVSKGRTADRSMFARQFGEPVSKNGRIWNYDYDKYTSIVLDCTKPSCYCRCAPKVQY